MKKFWEFKGLADKKGELYLYGEISSESWWGDEITPAQFQKDLAAMGDIDTLDVYINSPGGDVFAGVSIYNMLKRFNAQVNIHVDGIAASSASIVAMAGDKITMPKSATMMIHNAWAMSMGNKTEMRKLADELERIDGQLADVYSSRTGQKVDDISAWMEAERWMDGEEAVNDGFADELAENKKIAACADAERIFARYKHPPKIEQEPAADDGGIFIQQFVDIKTDDEITITDKDGKVIYCGAIAGMDFHNHTILLEHTDETNNQHVPYAKAQSAEVVYGPPCSGKSTYVRENMGNNDVVYDYDRLVRAMTTQDKRGVEKTAAHEIAIGIRGLIINRVKEDTPIAKAWFITRWPSDALKEKLDGLSFTMTRMETDRDTCLSRLDADDSRTDKDDWKTVINQWFEDHGTADNGEETPQPVADTTQPDGLKEQRKQIYRIKKKSYGGM